MRRGLPDRIHLVRMSRPMAFHERASFDVPTRVSLVDLDTLPRNDDAALNRWPEQKIDITDRAWKVFTWLGWSLVLVWKKGTNK